MKVRYTKWDGRPHWHFDLERLGHDHHGLWLGGRRGIPQQRGDEPPITLSHDFVMLVPAEGCYTAFWNGGGAVEVYVDVTTRPELTADTVSAVDLDLDVIRLDTGEVRLVDEDEFEHHRTLYSYPSWLVDQARATADFLVHAVSSRTGPFDQAGSRWLAAFAAATP